MGGEKSIHTYHDTFCLTHAVSAAGVVRNSACFPYGAFICSIIAAAIVEWDPDSEAQPLLLLNLFSMM